MGKNINRFAILFFLTMLFTSCRLSEDSGKLSEAMDVIKESNAAVEESSIDNHLSTESEELTEISEHEESDNGVKVGTGWGDEVIGLRYNYDVSELAFISLIVGNEKFNEYVNEFIEAKKFDKRPNDDPPYLYKMIAYFEITEEEFKDRLEKENAKSKYGNKYKEETVALLFCGDLERMKRELTHETAWYDNGNVYSFGELYDMSKSELKAIFETQEEFDRFTEKVTPFILKHSPPYIDFIEEMECRYKS